MTPEMNRIPLRMPARTASWGGGPAKPLLPTSEVRQESNARVIIGLDNWLSRIQQGKRRAARAGRHQGGITPYGYSKNYDPPAKRFMLEVDQYQASIVRTIFREYLRLKSLGRVSARLAELNIPAPNGTRWTRGTLGFILSNSVYLGNVKYGAIENKGEHNPIIAPIIFNKVQKIKEANRRSGRVESTVAASVR